jgi:copper chaperone NosL
MVDFWRWEYNYGHNLDPNAAIIVPGMAYQPPLIGYKQLLNFGAFSIPDIGGWIFVSVGVVLLGCVVAVWRMQKKATHAKRHLAAVAAILSMLLLSSCKAGPQPIRVGIDNCYYCKMTIADQRFGAEVVTNKGKVYKFDDAHCILSFLKTKEVTKDNIKDIYFADFGDEHQLRKVNDMFLCKTDEIKSPMGANIIAFSNKQALQEATQKFKCEAISWETLSNQ